MRAREFIISRKNLLLDEGIEDTKDVLAISQAITKWLYDNHALVPGSVIDIDLIPGLAELVKTPEGKTLINTTRLKIVGAKTLPTARGDAAPYYTDSKGNYIQGSAPYQDARSSKRIRQGKTPLLDPNSYDTFSDYISDRGKRGEKMTIRLNVDAVDVNTQGKQLQSTLTHELGHHLDVIKGRDTIATQRLGIDAKEAELQLHHHNQAKRGEKVATTLDGKIIIPPRAPIMLSPKHEKHLIGIVKKAPKATPGNSIMAYWKDTAEINARLMQASEDVADFLPTMLKNREQSGVDSKKIDDTIRYLLNKHHITVAFVDFASEVEFKAALDTFLTDDEIRRAYANPEFRKIYNRMYKFLESEMGPGGIMTQAAKTGFANWNQSLPTTSTESLAATRAGFIDRFKKVVIQGQAIVKTAVAKVLRYNHIADQAFNDLLKKAMPVMFSKGLLKSIPIAGALIGVAFGIQRLLKGDVPGAGIELVSGIGSLVTAIPATAYQAARDLYGEYYTQADTGNPAVYEYDLAQDPEGTNQRVKSLADQIAERLKAGIEENRNILKNLKVDPNLALI